MRQKYQRSSLFITGGHITWVIFAVKIYVFERLNRKIHFLKKIFSQKKTTQLLGRTGLQNMKVGVKANFG